MTIKENIKYITQKGSMISKATIHKQDLLEYVYTTANVFGFVTNPGCTHIVWILVWHLTLKSMNLIQNYRKYSINPTHSNPEKFFVTEKSGNP